ncbi:MAG: neutral/alkaline non-lysosomal ceramidase N-terminal domain-containing protein [Planctomycetales bacterium]|nr:neutral/alkaline non-lysosomal ceramidase N-terminal domain-containing protein [Planctomycetales bacterium]
MKWYAWFPLAVLFSLGPLSGDEVEQGPGDCAPSGLLAAVARADITPPVGIAQMNWGSQAHILSIGNDPVGLCATALVLADGRTKFAMVDIDRLFVNGLEPAIERASKLTGIPIENIRLSATHTHAAVNISAAKGPAGMDLSEFQAAVERYDESIIDKIVGLLVQANAELQPAHIFGDRGQSKININRRVRADGENPPAVGRNPVGFVDRELIVFRIDDASGQPLAVLANYPCHGTVLAYENKKISPDWIGMVRQVVEDAMPTAKCLFFQGAAGNQGPIEGFTGDLAVAHRLGAILGHSVSSIALGIETVHREPTFEGFVESTAYQAKQHWRVKGPRGATLARVSKTIQLPRRTYTESEIEGMAERLSRATVQAALAQKGDDAWALHQADARVRRFKDLLEKWRQPADPTPLEVQVEIWKIGDVGLVSMPGEPFAEIGVAIREASPFEHTMFCGYSDGIGGDYMPITCEYDHGGYEVERTPYGREADKRLIAETTALFEVFK